MSKAKPTTSRIDCVFIRKSSPTQDEGPQIANVTAMLKELGVYIPDQNWFVCTVPRANVQANADFNRLMGLVKAGKVGTVYIESQDRWGTGFVRELFSLLRVFSDHGTRLYDLKDRTDLTGTDDTTEMKVFLAGFKSKKEREDLAYRSLRSKVNNLKDTGSWPSGVQPYGYGKACYGPGGELLWVWQPRTREWVRERDERSKERLRRLDRGQLFHPTTKGTLTPGRAGVPIPRKDKRQRIVLIPSDEPDRVRAVQLAFDLFVRVGLSRRQICSRLAREGLTLYGKPFDHCDITAILSNPAYVGDTFYGKVQAGKFHSFDGNGGIVKTGGKPVGGRSAAECLVKPNTHEGLVDRKTWEYTQKKLAAEQERPSYSPRNPAHYLKQVLVCGHCGKGMTGRMETHPSTKEKTAVYVCSTYMKEQSRGSANTCGYQRITHADAEQLLLDKIQELNLPFDLAASEGARSNLEARLTRLGYEGEEAQHQWERWFADGMDAFADYLNETYGNTIDYHVFRRLKLLAAQVYWEVKAEDMRSFARLPIASLAELRTAIRMAEETALDAARKKLTELEAEHAAYTRSWVKATSELQQAVLKQDMDRLEREIADWKPRTVPLSERLKTLLAAEEERKAEREQLLAEWPALENREKGEALRRLFNTMTLFWEKTWHPAPPKPTRPRKTQRPGRYSYTLQKGRIQWSYAAADLTSDSSY